jgi:hypothetical protein
MEAVKYETLFINEPVKITREEFETIRSEILINKELALNFKQGLFCKFFNDYLTWFNVTMLLLAAVYFAYNKSCEPVLWLIISGLTASLYLTSKIPCYLYELKKRKQQLYNVKSIVLRNRSYQNFVEDLYLEFEYSKV